MRAQHLSPHWIHIGAAEADALFDYLEADDKLIGRA